MKNDKLANNVLTYVILDTVYCRLVSDLFSPQVLISLLSYFSCDLKQILSLQNNQ